MIHTYDNYLLPKLANKIFYKTKLNFLLPNLNHQEYISIICIPLNNINKYFNFYSVFDEFSYCLIFNDFVCVTFNLSNPIHISDLEYLVETLQYNKQIFINIYFDFTIYSNSQLIITYFRKYNKKIYYREVNVKFSDFNNFRLKENFTLTQQQKYRCLWKVNDLINPDTNVDYVIPF